jgi:hypothetical protein
MIQILHIINILYVRAYFIQGLVKKVGSFNFTCRNIDDAHSLNDSRSGIVMTVSTRRYH